MFHLVTIIRKGQTLLEYPLALHSTLVVLQHLPDGAEAAQLYHSSILTQVHTTPPALGLNTAFIKFIGS